MLFPRFIRTKSIADHNGNRRSEWLVRGLPDETYDERGIKVKTPTDLLNRYYRSDLSIPISQSIVSTSKTCFLRYEDIEKDEFFLSYT